MKKIFFYISNLLNENPSISDFENKIIEFCDTFQNIIDNHDEVIVPQELYTSTLNDGTTFADYLFMSNYASDVRNLLYEYIIQYKTEEIRFDTLNNLLDNNNNTSYKALVGMGDNQFIRENRLYVNNKNKLLTPHRFYLEKLNSIAEFKQNFKNCFPNLIFHQRVDTTINAFHNIAEHSTELIRHLSVLNDFAKKIYTDTGGSSDEIYERLKIEHNIIASGRGSNEDLNNFKCSFNNLQGMIEVIRCNPHTKLYTSYSNFRIYFNWGRENIENGKILVGHMGTHWI